MSKDKWNSQTTINKKVGLIYRVCTNFYKLYKIQSLVYFENSFEEYDEEIIPMEIWREEVCHIRKVFSKEKSGNRTLLDLYSNHCNI